MRPELLALFLVVGLGNYLMRSLPLLLALRRSDPGEEARNASATKRRPDPLALVGPCVVVALLVTTVLPAVGEPGFAAGLARNLAALLPTAFVAARTRNLGLTVLVGVVSYGATTALAAPR